MNWTVESFCWRLPYSLTVLTIKYGDVVVRASQLSHWVVFQSGDNLDTYIWNMLEHVGTSREVAWKWNMLETNSPKCPLIGSCRPAIPSHHLLGRIPQINRPRILTVYNFGLTKKHQFSNPHVATWLILQRKCRLLYHWRTRGNQPQLWPPHGCCSATRWSSTYPNRSRPGGETTGTGGWRRIQEQNID